MDYKDVAKNLEKQYPEAINYIRKTAGKKKNICVYYNHYMTEHAGNCVTHKKI